MWFALGTTLWEPWVLRVHFLPYAFNPGKVPYHRRMFFLKMPLPHALRDWELCWGGEILRRKFWETLGQSADKGLLQVRTRLPWWLNGKEFPGQAGDRGSIPGSGRSPGEGSGYPLQHSCLGNPMDRGAWRATVHRVSEEMDTTEWLNNNR